MFERVRNPTTVTAKSLPPPTRQDVASVSAVPGPVAQDARAQARFLWLPVTKIRTCGQKTLPYGEINILAPIVGILDSRRCHAGYR